MFILRATLLLLAVFQAQCAVETTAVMYKDNSMTTVGTLKFYQESADKPVHITGAITGLNASSAHGIHIHVNPVSDGSPNCTAAGVHFNPFGVNHGPPSADKMGRHVGDLGNITTQADGSVEVHLHDSLIQLYGDVQNILGRTIIIHLLRDDGGMGGFSDSTTTGNAGARILCGLIKKNNGFSIKPGMSALWLVIMTIIYMKFF